MAASTTVMILLGIGLFFSWSVALISPPSSNRALPVRLYFLVTWLLLAVNFGVWDVVLGCGHFHQERTDPDWKPENGIGHKRPSKRWRGLEEMLEMVAKGDPETEVSNPVVPSML